MTKETPIAVTVLMPVYNSELYLKDAIDSILNQTFKNFELLIVNDGSSDSSDKIIRSFDDSRINYINNQVNKGIVAALNEGLNLSRGKFIARMDADDIADSERLAKQYEFLVENPDYKLCGTNAIAINNKGEENRRIKRPHSSEKIKVLQLFRNAFIHPTIMADAEVMKSFGYAKDYEYAEDYLLFSQITMNHKVTNLDYSGIKYRLHSESISAKKLDEMAISEMKTMKYLLSFLFDDVSDFVLASHHSLLRPKQHINPQETQQIEKHLLAIKNINSNKLLFSAATLDTQLKKEWFETLKKSTLKNKVKAFISSELFSFHMSDVKRLFKLLFV